MKTKVCSETKKSEQNYSSDLKREVSKNSRRLSVLIKCTYKNKSQLPLFFWNKMSEPEGVKLICSTLNATFTKSDETEMLGVKGIFRSKILDQNGYLIKNEEKYRSNVI